MKLSLPTDSAERKTWPLFNGLFGYFGAALAAVAHHSWKNNEKHNPGQPLHWSIDKSNDHLDCVLRHALDLGDMYAALDRLDLQYYAEEYEPLRDKLLEEADALAWRALAYNQTLRMEFGLAPIPFNAKHSVPSVFEPIEPAAEVVWPDNFSATFGAVDAVENLNATINKLQAAGFIADDDGVDDDED